MVIDDEETITKIENLVEEHNTKNPLYGNTLYLKSKNLSEKQKEELFGKGKAHITVHFKFTGTYTKGEVSYLTFKVTKLHKIAKPKSDDSCPEY